MEDNMKGNISEQMAPFNQTIYYGLQVQSSNQTVLRHVEVTFLWTVVSKISYVGIALLPFSISLIFPTGRELSCKTALHPIVQ